jgi:hypothetical protein
MTATVRSHGRKPKRSLRLWVEVVLVVAYLAASAPYLYFAFLAARSTCFFAWLWTVGVYSPSPTHAAMNADAMYTFTFVGEYIWLLIFSGLILIPCEQPVRNIVRRWRGK